jgi:hypothetical protein
VIDTGARGEQNAWSDALGSLRSDFTVYERIGEGSSAIVHRAVHKSMGVEVALKVWRRRLTPTQRERFLHECGAQWALSDHSHVVRLLWASAPDDGPPWIATELYKESLADRQRRFPPLSRDEALTVTEDVLRGLGAIHGSGLVHRDVTPGNVFLSNGRAALGDFGIAVPVWGCGADRAGTERFMAPEVLGGADPSPRSDVYSAAVTLRSAFAHVPHWLEPLFTRAASQHPEDRPVDGAAFRARVKAARPDEDLAAPPEPPRTEGASPDPSEVPATRGWHNRHRRAIRRRRVIGALAVAAAFCGMAGWYLKSDERVVDRQSAASPTRVAPGAPAAPPAAARPSVRNEVIVPESTPRTTEVPEQDLVTIPVDRGAEVRWPEGDGTPFRVSASAPGTPTRICTAAGSNSCQLTGLMNGVTYTVSVGSADGSGTTPMGTVMPYPSSIMGDRDLALWLDAADRTTLFDSAQCTGEAAGRDVGCWADKSDAKNDAVVEGADSRPAVTGDDSRRALSFATKDALRLTRSADLPLGDKESTTFIVGVPEASLAGPAQTAVYWSTSGSASARVFYKEVGGPYAGVGTRIEQRKELRWGDQLGVLVGEHSASGTGARLDGANAPTRLSVSTPGASGAWVGRGPAGNFWQGTIAEIVVIDRLLGPSERAEVEGYLYRKWDIPPP